MTLARAKRLGWDGSLDEDTDVDPYDYEDDELEGELDIIALPVNEMYLERTIYMIDGQDADPATLTDEDGEPIELSAHAARQARDREGRWMRVGSQSVPVTDAEIWELTLDAVGSWKGSPDAVQEQANAILTGTEVLPPANPHGYEDVRVRDSIERVKVAALLTEVATNGTVQNREMYRGIHIDGFGLDGPNIESVRAEYASRGEIVFGPQGFTSREDIARDFAGLHQSPRPVDKNGIGYNTSVPVRFVVKPGSSMLSIERYAETGRPPEFNVDNSDTARAKRMQAADTGEAEYIAAGRFRVESVQVKNARRAESRGPDDRYDYVEVRLEQAENLRAPEGGFG